MRTISMNNKLSVLAPFGVYLLFVLLLIFVAACGDLPAPSPNGAQQTQDTERGDTIDEPDLNDPPPNMPDLMSLPSAYGYSSIPIRGQTDQHLSIFVEGGKAPIATDADASGSFCVDVPLKAEVRQMLSVYAQDSRGVTSDAATAVVTHDPTLVEAVVTEPTLEDLATGQLLFSDGVPKEGSLSNITDDNPTSSTLVYASTIWVDLGDWFDIERVEVVFTGAAMSGDDTFATEYQILAATSDSPTFPPAAGEAGWALLYDINPQSFVAGGDGGVDAFDLSATLDTRYLAFYFIENNMIDWFSSEDIRVADIHIYGRSQEDTVVTPETPSCENGLTP